MKLSIRPQKINVYFILLVSAFIGFSCSDDVPHFILSESDRQKIEAFSEHCRRNDIIIDSLKAEINKKYNYPIEISINAVDLMRADIINSVPYYGMTDGQNAFIFSLHFMKVYEVDIYYQGSDKYTILGDGLFFMDEAWVKVKPSEENGYNTNFFDARMANYKKHEKENRNSRYHDKFGYLMETPR